MNRKGATEAADGPGRSLPTAVPTSPEVPLVPDYELLRRIGGGSYGEVWLARSRATGVLRAAKIVSRRAFDHDRPFQREFEGLQRFERISREHSSQLALFHIGRNEAEGYFYYVMELADAAKPLLQVESGALRVERKTSDDTGSQPSTPTSLNYSPRTLRADLEAGRLPSAQVLEIGLTLTEALGHLHRNGLVHRDVKPSNVIFVGGRPKLADIGLVTDASDTCSIVGTEGYLPPEGPGTPQADLFALGKVLYEATTGLDRRELPKLPEGLRTWSDANQVFELNEVILKACAHNVRDRYRSAEEMHADLVRLQRGESVKGQNVWRNRRQVARRIGLVATVITLAAVVSVLLWQTIIPHGAQSLPSANEDGTAGTRNPEAAQAYRLGLPGLRRGTIEGFRQALENFTAATDADPQFAAAYARLFEIYLMSEDHGIAIIDGKTEQLNQLSARLTKIAPTNAETHAVRGITLFINEWKWAEAEREFKQALELDPRCRLALTYHGYLLTRLGRADEARPVLERALATDPTSPLVTKFLGHCEFVARRYENALQFYLRASELEPSYPSSHYWAGRAYLAMTNHAQALDEFEQHTLKQGKDPRWAAEWFKDLRAALAKGGTRDVWTQAIDMTKEDSFRVPYSNAELFARLGDKAQALDWLEKALAQHDPMEQLLTDEFWDGCRDEPRFKRILRAVGLDPGGH